MSNLVIVRSGFCFSDVREARSACIDNRKPVFRYRLVGLRLGLDLGQSSRAIRGGSWFDGVRHVRAACRFRSVLSDRDDDIGLHLALDTDPAQPQQENIQ